VQINVREISKLLRAKGPLPQNCGHCAVPSHDDEKEKIFHLLPC
jgi:hypothetical protein